MRKKKKTLKEKIKENYVSEGTIEILTEIADRLEKTEALLVEHETKINPSKKDEEFPKDIVDAFKHAIKHANRAKKNIKARKGKRKVINQKLFKLLTSEPKAVENKQVVYLHCPLTGRMWNI